MDKRHVKRIKIVQQLFTNKFFIPEKNNQNQVNSLTIDIIKNEQKINQYIQKYASKFPIEKIAKIDLAILQLAIYELMIEKKEPVKVIINEAVELAKEFGGEKSYAFVNAVLGKIYTEISKKEKNF
jgi:N utilization substance protein B